MHCIVVLIQYMYHDLSRTAEAEGFLFTARQRSLLCKALYYIPSVYFVCHSLSYQNDSSYDHAVFIGG